MDQRIKAIKTQVLHQGKYTLKSVTYEERKDDGTAKTVTREVYDRGDAAAILLYNKQQQTVLLTRQFRLPSFLNGNKNGVLIEACAGMLDKDDPETCARREAQEETGFNIATVQHAFSAYTSPGGVTEIIHCFVAAYTPDMKVAAGGGLAVEGEHIELLEPTLDDALHMIATGAIQDAKTIMLLQYTKLHNLI